MNPLSAANDLQAKSTEPPVIRLNQGATITKTQFIAASVAVAVAFSLGLSAAHGRQPREKDVDIQLKRQLAPKPDLSVRPHSWSSSYPPSRFQVKNSGNAKARASTLKIDCLDANTVGLGGLVASIVHFVLERPNINCAIICLVVFGGIFIDQALFPA